MTYLIKTEIKKIYTILYRHIKIFNENASKTNYLFNEPFQCMQQAFNQFLICMILIKRIH